MEYAGNPYFRNDLGGRMGTRRTARRDPDRRGSDPGDYVGAT